MIDSAIQSVLGEAWLQGRLRYNYLTPDQVVAEAVAYHEDGQIRFRYPVQNHKIHGLCQIWYANGVLQCEESYENNSLHGLHKQWHPNGQLKREAYYKNGILNGPRHEWYETGIQSLKSTYIDDRLHGVYTEWYGNGHLKYEFNFAMGRRNGTFKYCHSDGTLKRKEIYANDIRLPERIFKLIETKTLTAKDILDIKNAAVRRICLEHLGYAQFLSQIEYKVIEKEGDYELVSIDWHPHEEPIFLVKVRCPSTSAFYTLRVPPHVLTIRQAVAWTFGLKANEYTPEKET